MLFIIHQFHLDLIVINYISDGEKINLMYYIKKFKMNLKERGFTVGDLIILLIVIFFSFLVINKKENSKTQKQITNLYYLEMQKNY